MSHVALLLSTGVVIHSTGKGVEFWSEEEFRSHNQIVAEAEYLGFQIEPSDLVVSLMLSERKRYDLLLLFCMGLRRLGIPIPEFEQPNALICTELISEYILGDSETNYTPGALLTKLWESPIWKVRKF